MNTRTDFNLTYYDSFDHPCGCIVLWMIKTEKTGISLRHIAHHHTLQHHRGSCVCYCMTDKTTWPWTRPTTWEEIWNACDSFYVKKCWTHKFKGKLKRGFMFADGNTIHAYAEDLKGNFLHVEGSYS